MRSVFYENIIPKTILANWVSLPKLGIYNNSQNEESK